MPTREDVLAGRHPAMVLVHGDTSSAMAAALSAFHLRIPVMHVEAGLRTGGSNLTPFPEELNRQVISTIAAMHFAPTSENLENLVRENIPVEQVFVTGNTGIDALQWSSAMDVRFANPELQALCDSDRRVVVITAHRRENWGDGLRGIAEGVARLADRHPEIGFVLPVHPNPRVREVLTERLQGLDNVLLTEPLGYATFARLLGRSSHRHHRLRRDPGRGPVARQAGPGDAGDDRAHRGPRRRHPAPGRHRPAGDLRRGATGCSKIDVAYREMAEAENPYGDGHAAERIVACARAPSARDRSADPVRHRLQPRRGGGRRRDALRARGRGRGSCAPRSTRRRSPSPAPGSARATSRQELVEQQEAAVGGRVARLTGKSCPACPAWRWRRPAWPFEGLALPWVILFTVCLVVVVAMFGWTLLLFVRGHSAIVAPPEPPPAGADAFTWVFLVPAMNEEVVIADSVERLLALPVARKRIVVIDDASDDRTPQILAAIDHPDLFVLRRDKPDAQKGKAAGLNYAYRALRDYADRDRTIVVIVDADGRLDAEAPHCASGHFADPKVGGVQALVRMYNRRHAAGLAAGRRVRRLRAPLPGGAQPLGDGGNGRQRPVQPAERARRGRRRGGAVARQADRGPGPRAAADRGGVGGAAGPARGGRAAGALEGAPAVPPAHPLVAGQPAGDLRCGAR